MKGKPFKKGNKFAWKPGQSGGSFGGRSSKDMRKLAEEFGAQVNPKTGQSKDEHLLELLYRKGCQGSARHAELYLAYRFGKPVQYSVTAEVPLEQKIAGMSEDEMHARLADLLSAYRQPKGRIQ